MLAVLCSVSLLPYVIFVAMGVGQIEPSNLMESNVTTDGFADLVQVPYIYTHARTHTCWHSHHLINEEEVIARVCARICVHVRVFVHMCILTCIYVLPRITQAMDHERRVFMCVCVCVCVCVCTRAYAYVYMQVVFWNMNGFDCISTSMGEVQNPTKTVGVWVWVWMCER